MKTVLVTGGTRGLGLAIVKHLAVQDCQVIAAGRTLSAGLSDFMARHEPRNNVSFGTLDLSLPETIHGFVRDITNTHGPLYGLVNNAALGYDGVLATMHESQIDELIRVNLYATILVTKYACRSMLTQRAGRIVNVSSIIANTGFNGLSVYAATKAGLIGFTKSLAREVGKAGITVNCVAPGFMDTDMTHEIDEAKKSSIRRRSPMGKMADVEDVAETILFLLSDRAKSITGTTLTVDAGSSA